MMQIENSCFLEIERRHPSGLRVREANQCPFAGGEAVMRARTILYLIEGYTVYNDKVICGANGIAMREGNLQTNTLFNLYPNPANETVTIEYKIQNDCNAHLILLNAIGQTIRTIEIDSKKNTTLFSIRDLQQGIYHYQLKCDDAKLSNGKLVIIH